MSSNKPIIPDSLDPPSLKEQAIAVLEDAELDAVHYNILLRALEQLND